MDDSAGSTVYMKFGRNRVTNDLCSSNECWQGPNNEWLETGILTGTTISSMGLSSEYM